MKSAVNIRETVADVYDAIGLRAPSVERCIAPLDRLVRGYELTRTEIAGLTSRTAAQFLLRRGGIEAAIEVDETPLAGFLYVSPRFGCIFVEQSDMVMRRRFSVAHELGHYFLHFRPLLDELAVGDEPLLIEATDAFLVPLDDAEIDELPESRISVRQAPAGSLPPVRQMETEANEFAAELLMPEEVVREKVSRLEGELQDAALISRLATDLLVSAAAMRWRVRKLGILRESGMVS